MCWSASAANNKRYVNIVFIALSFVPSIIENTKSAQVSSLNLSAARTAHGKSVFVSGK